MAKAKKTTNSKHKLGKEVETRSEVPVQQDPAIKLTPRLALLKVGSISGVFTGLACLIFFVVLATFSDVNPLTPIRNLDLGLLVLSYIFTFWFIKNGRPDGRFQFWEGLFVGFVITFITAILSGGLVAGYLTWFKPEVLAEYIKWSVDIAEKLHKQTLEKFTEDGYQTQLNSIKAMTAIDIWQDTLIKKLLPSIILIPIVATIMRKTVLATN